MLLGRKRIRMRQKFINAPGRQTGQGSKKTMPLIIGTGFFSTAAQAAQREGAGSGTALPPRVYT